MTDRLVVIAFMRSSSFHPETLDPMNRVTTSGDTMPRQLNVIAIVKDTERFIFLYDDNAESINRLFQQMGIMAADRESSFTWYDAAVMSQKVRKLSESSR